MADTTVAPFDLDACAREAIHIPGAIQPHGVMLVIDQSTQEVRHVAGDVARILGVVAWQGRPLAELLGRDLAERIAEANRSEAVEGYRGRIEGPLGGLDVTAHADGQRLILEVEPGLDVAMPATEILGQLEAAGAAFERAPNLKGLCDRAAVAFRRLTGFDRVMVYRFLDDDAGVVLAEDAAPGMPSFLNHHFPGSDIPAQARSLYIRNLVRVIADALYQPAPLEPAWDDPEPLDMSDCALRSVSAVHLQYLRNMGVGASASISIVKDGVLWGLIACHHREPRLMPFDTRAAARALAGSLARQVRAEEEAESYRERLRLRGLEDEVTSGLARAVDLDAHLPEGAPALRRMLDADGVAALRGDDLHLDGVCPAENQVRELARWVMERGPDPVCTDRLGEHYPPASAFLAEASGLLGVMVSNDEPFVILWFRAEELEAVNWAGNPHKAVGLGPGEKLTPRASFEAWQETVRGRSRRWTLAEVDAVTRLRATLQEARNHRRLAELNARLAVALGEKDGLIEQKEMLLKEVNHRIQNSLQLVSSFLALQSRALGDPMLHAAFEEARRRIQAVALVHRRLYRADQIETVDLGRYLEELIGDMNDSMAREWAGLISVDTAPVLVPTDRAVTIGLVVTELVINANKYAYGGAPGPIEVSLEEHRAGLRIIVADHGKGNHAPGEGFGSRMMAAMVRQLTGQLTLGDNKPGLRAILSCPVSVAAPLQ